MNEPMMEKIKNICDYGAVIATLLCYVLVYPLSKVFVKKYADNEGVWVLIFIVLAFSILTWFFGKIWMPFVEKRLPANFKFFPSVFLKLSSLLILIVHMVILGFFVLSFVA